MVLAVLVMMVAAEPISRFVEAHRPSRFWRSRSAADRVVAGRRQLRAHRKGLHLLRHGLLGVRRDDQHPDRKKGPPVVLRHPYLEETPEGSKAPGRLTECGPGRPELTAESTRAGHSETTAVCSWDRGPFHCHAPSIAAQSSYVPQRVCDTADKRFVDFEAMLVELAKATSCSSASSTTIRIPARARDSRRTRPSARRRHRLARDVRARPGALEHFLMDHVSEEDFLKVARPWPRYATDYKPLVEYAMSKDWPVLAANVPSRLRPRCRNPGSACSTARATEKMVRAGARVFNQRRLLQAVRGRDEPASGPPGSPVARRPPRSAR